MKNKALALKLLAKDCQIAARYVDGANTCAIGCLALASGVSRRTLQRHNSTAITSNCLRMVAGKISKKFGLDRWQLRNIQTANDGKNTVEDRREAVLKVVRAIN